MGMDWGSATAEMIEEAARSDAQVFAERGMTATEARNWSARAATDPAWHPSDAPLLGGGRGRAGRDRGAARVAGD